MNEPGALDERLRTLVMQSFERGGERLRILLHTRPPEPLNQQTLKWFKTLLYDTTVLFISQDISRVEALVQQPKKRTFTNFFKP
ncbi:MAG: hypothetical protein GY702_28975 [Desulfobulbaceae bacterium]|nr:hypothetical protein [Desulfobulbaceae bacterium]